MFDCSKCLGELTRHLDDGAHNLTDERRAIVKKFMANRPYRPVTLGDFQTLEAEARERLDNRIDRPVDHTPDLNELDDGSAIGTTSELRQWAADVLLDAKIWEYIAADLAEAFDITGKRRSAAA